MRQGAARFGTIILMGGLLCGTAPQTGYDMPTHPQAPPRRVYVLHSGLHFVLSKAGKNGAAERLRHELSQRGIAERDLVVLDNPFRTASWSEVLPRESVAMFLESADPSSPTAREAYVRLERALSAHGVTPRDRIVWVGHSAGGQMGMTMARLAEQTRRYRFDTVITLGTPVVANTVPREVQLRHYYSSADSVVRLLSNHSALVSASLGHQAHFAPCCDVGPNVKVRVFQGIRHHTWTSSPAVIDAILAEASDRRPARRTVDGPAGLALGQLLAAVVEQECQVCFEE